MSMLVPMAVLAVTYVGIAFPRLPRVKLDRPSAAFIGAVLMVLLGVLSTRQAVAAIDFNTITLLLGMMVLIAVLELDGFFGFLAAKTFAVAQTPRRLLVVVATATAVFSALLVNDAVVLLFTPVVIRACRMMRVNPVPYLLVEAMASNTGSVATMVGNPQNMLIGISSGVSFVRFFGYLAPVAVLSTALLIVVALFLYRKELTPKRDPLTVAEMVGTYSLGSMRWSVPIAGVTVVLFFLSSSLGLQVPVIALGAAAAVLLLGRSWPSEVLGRVDWGLLLFFASLFVVIAGANHGGILDTMIKHIDLASDPVGIGSLLFGSAALSQIVSNVPLSMLAIPFIQQTPGDTLWMVLAAGATLGGNATLMGAVANLIVVERAAKDGVQVSFMQFLRLGLLVTVGTLFIAWGVLALEIWTGVLR